MRLFCFPHAGGNATTFREWTHLLPETIELSAIQLPGRGARLDEEPCSDITVAARAVVNAIGPLLGCPFALLGHSLGAVIAFEVLRTLRLEGAREPLRLVVAGSAAPHLAVNHADLSALTDQDLLNELRTLDGTPNHVFDSPGLLQMILPSIRADFRMAARYKHIPAAPLPTAITVLGGTDDSVPRECLMKWSELSTAPISVHMVAGGHFFVQTARSQVVQIVLQSLNESGFSV
jgi:medium-chain acyl-[acyl-carrier-protein] hydrolase